ncbi:MAG: tetraprenyl-beta-curcumene synthase family protein [Clostridia bacterium]|nr:tetraprenyl-beta-curcumene synthase family protein [Clostridia bacterium]
MIYDFVGKVFPEVDRQLNRWINLCIQAEDHELSEQALSSIRFKKFHAQGGSAYALYPKVNCFNAIDFIVSFQTISDYLDNLCDRAGVCDEYSFRQLHLSMLDAIEPDTEKNDYYLLYPYKNDNSYLESLVDECRSRIKELPSYRLVKNYIKNYVQLYCDLQTYKHLSLDKRERRLISWAAKQLEHYPGISCWEFSAASGSTLGVFALYAAACDPDLTSNEVATIDALYFPWICGLHILLDYYIDAQEDLQMGDLNFTYYYENLKQCEDRLLFFVEQSLSRCSGLKYPGFHMTVIKGLLAMYLSDPKASMGMNRLASRNILRSSGKKTEMYYNICRLLRLAGAL